MNSEQYRDEIDSLRFAIGSFQSCATEQERALESDRLMRAWRRLAMTEQPKRLKPYDRELAERVLARAAALLNEYGIHSASKA